MGTMLKKEHIVRMEEGKTAFESLISKLKGKRLVGRPRRR